MEPRDFLILAKGIASEPYVSRPPDEGVSAETHQVLPPAIVRATRGYIEKVANQINGCYEKGWYDACAVMMRRLLETLIVEAYEKHGIEAAIKNSSGDYLYLRDLVAAAVSQAGWTLTRNTKNALPRLKDLGDKSAHSRRYIAHRQDIEAVIADFRGVIQEFVFLAGLK